MDQRPAKRRRRLWLPGHLLALTFWFTQIPPASSETPGSPPTNIDGQLHTLLKFEEREREQTKWASRTRANFGADPVKILPTSLDDRWIGILRGNQSIVLLDGDARTRARVDAPGNPTGATRAATGELLVVGESSGKILRFRISDDEIRPLAPLRVPGVTAIRDIATLGNEWILLDPVEHEILAVDARSLPATVRRLADCRGPTEVLNIEGWILANCLLDHQLLLLDPQGKPLQRIENDGPFWSLAARRVGEHLLVIAGGVENRPLDRSDGAFGYIDSFAFLYRVELSSGKIVSSGTLNLSQLGIVMPKWLEWGPGKQPEVRLAGYASEGLLQLTWENWELNTRPEIRRTPLPPGTRDAVGNLAANPLLDAWVRLGDKPEVVKIASPTSRTLASRVGEALFFTTLMAPWNESGGPRSRFTCETCHHEGYVDGRTHYTGRGKVYATTRPLVGLHGNRPYFSRALDPTMARMVHNEFRVANKANGHDPWFALAPDTFSWILAPGETHQELSPLFLRRALMTFLMQLEHEANPRTSDRTHFDARERSGAATFQQHCEGCHTARLISDDPSSKVPFEAWERNIFSAGTILWGQSGYEKTGVTPYVHPRGARVPSLRRLHKKRPLFTNGVAPDLESLLDAFALDAPGQEHQGGKTKGRQLSLEQRQDLLAFLGLL